MAVRIHGSSIALLLIMISLLLLPAIDSASPQKPRPEKALASSYTGFGFDLYEVLLDEHEGKNVFISPASIAFALAMTYNGAAGSSEAAIAQTLGIDGMGKEGASEANALLIQRLDEASSDVELSIANSLWLKKTFNFHPDFLERNERYFGADVFSVLSAPRINDWVSEKTKDKIDKIIDSIPTNTISIIINAIYFKGMWAQKFDKKETKTEDFHLPGGGTKEHPLMRQRGKFAYLETGDFQAVSLPYGKGRISMYVFLPKEETGIAAFHEILESESWERWMPSFSRRKGYIVLPRFKMEFAASLKNTLISLGMDLPFSPREADFSNMCPTSAQNVFIQNVLHKTFVEVNEEGTEAAAVTGVVVGVTSVQPVEEPFEMIVDRPFFVAIRDNATGLVLFMGSIVDP